MPSYSVFGLSLLASRPISWLEPAGNHALPTTNVPLRVDFGHLPGTCKRRVESMEPLYESPDSLESRGPVMTVVRHRKTGDYHFELAFGTRFVVNAQATAVTASWGDGAGFDDACHDLLGPVLGLVLHLRGISCLHASAVHIDNRAVGLVGRRGAGKSSTAIGFASNGYTVVSDDVVAVSTNNGRPCAHPAYPRLCLWQDTADAFASSFGDLSPLTQTWNKRYLDLRSRGASFTGQALPLSAVYELDGRCSALESPSITPLVGRHALMSLVEHTYVGYLLDESMRGGALDRLGLLVSQVPVFRVTTPDGLQHIDSLCTGIADHHRTAVVGSA